MGSVLLAALSSAGCGSDESTSEQGDCSVTLEPGDDDTTSVGSALADARAGQTLCLQPGTYRFTRELGLTTPNVTVRGLGATPEDVIWDFSAQEGADNGMDVSADGFTIENLWVKNTPGNGIVVSGAEDVIFRKLKVTWDAGSVVENGAYAVYPVRSTRVLIEETEVIGAADAGLYVGQCTDVIVRNNRVHGNVAGIEIENTSNAEVYGNEAYDNTAGVLVFVLPNLEKKEGVAARVYENDIHDNNRPNFAEPGTIVATVPHGTGVLVLAAHDTELHDNRIANNASVGVVVTSYATLKLVLENSSSDPQTDEYTRRTYLHDNTFTNNGTDPQGLILAIKTAADTGAAPVEDVLWDGALGQGETPGTLCLGTEAQPSFRNFNGLSGLASKDMQSTDVGPHTCDLPSLPPVSL